MLNQSDPHQVLIESPVSVHLLSSHTYTSPYDRALSGFLEQRVSRSLSSFRVSILSLFLSPFLSRALCAELISRGDPDPLFKIVSKFVFFN